METKNIAIKDKLPVLKKFFQRLKAIEETKNNIYKNLVIPFILILLSTSCEIDSLNFSKSWALGSDVRYFTLKINIENGSFQVNPVKEKYVKGETVTVTVTPDSGYDFYAWEGDEVSANHPLELVMDKNKVITARFKAITASKIYYVNYENDASADVSNNGLSSSNAWKHAPGDPAATGYPSSIVLGPGDKVYFRGGVTYRGSISIPASGSLNNPIVYSGNSWPAGSKAVIDGGDLLTGWQQCTTAAECGGNTNYASIYYTTIDGSYNPLELNLHEYNTTTSKDEFLWISQYPIPAEDYFFDVPSGFRTISQSNFTRTSLTDKGLFSLYDSNWWVGAYIMIYTNPQAVLYRKVTSYNESSGTITFDDLGVNAKYPDGRDQSYAVYNCINTITQSGQYCVSSIDQITGKRTIFVWPRSNSSLDSRISMSVRKYGINVTNRSNITIDGFHVRKHCHAVESMGIGSYTDGYVKKSRIKITNNIIEHNYNGTSIFLANVTNSKLDNNEVSENPKQTGIFINTGKYVTINNNTVYRSGGTSIRYYTVDTGQVVGNVVNETRASHANGLTFYVACNNILVANNKIFKSKGPITFQDSGNLYFINNLIDCDNDSENVGISGWPNTTRGPWCYGTIAILNNTVVRQPDKKGIQVVLQSKKNTYIMMNNIVDGLLSSAFVDRNHNLYTGLCWNQSLSTDEYLATDVYTVFVDPDNLNFKLKAGSPAISKGVDVSGIYPVSIFPDFDFNSDINGTTRTGWDLGAYDY